MSNLDMQSMVDVVSDVNALIATYGLTVVKHAFNYVEAFPVQKSTMVRFGNMFDLTQEQFKEVDRQYANGMGKIMAIKQVREYTSCGLKEAKDAVEAHYGYKPANKLPW